VSCRSILHISPSTYIIRRQGLWFRLVRVYTGRLLVIYLPARRFDTVDSAERCIEGLRKYRNLHPSFSKVCFDSILENCTSSHSIQQIHKIPGTAYASINTNRSTATLSIHGSESSEKCDLSGWTGEFEGGSGSDSFKARMEKLQDNNSTNLYIEGLPLSIDDAVSFYSVLIPYVC
jgi:hypothetical protein